MNLSNQGKIGYCISVGCMVAAPVEGGYGWFNSAGQANTQNTRQISIPKAGKIKAIRIYTYSGTAGTNEAIKSVYCINGFAPVDLVTVSAATNRRDFISNNLNITVAEGDLLELALFCGNWVTNPANMGIQATIYIE